MLQVKAIARQSLGTAASLPQLLQVKARSISLYIMVIALLFYSKVRSLYIPVRLQQQQQQQKQQQQQNPTASSQSQLLQVKANNNRNNNTLQLQVKANCCPNYSPQLKSVVVVVVVVVVVCCK
jgi:hypothetical protein